MITCTTAISISPTAIPASQHAAAKSGTGAAAKLSRVEIPVPEPSPDQILVKMAYTGVCATDTALLRDQWASSGVQQDESTLGIAGHEGAGMVVAVGKNVEHLWAIGDRAGIRWNAGTCRTCEACAHGGQCEKPVTSGCSIAGTFQEYCVTDGLAATRLPAGVSDAEAGPLLCGGVTAYVGCKRSGVGEGGWIVVMGAGSGVGHLAVQYAKGMGMRVVAVDEGEEKGELCVAMGAEEYVDGMACEDVVKEVMSLAADGVGGVVVCLAGEKAFEQAAQMVRTEGTVVYVGSPEDPTRVVSVPSSLVESKKLNVLESVTATLKDVDECLDFTARGVVRPLLTQGSLEDIDEFLDDIEADRMVGRAVIRVSS